MKREKFGIISVKGKTVCPFVFNEIENFENGLARFRIAEKRMDVEGFINTQCKIFRNDGINKLVLNHRYCAYEYQISRVVPFQAFEYINGIRVNDCNEFKEGLARINLWVKDATLNTNKIIGT